MAQADWRGGDQIGISDNAGHTVPAGKESSV